MQNRRNNEINQLKMLLTAFQMTYGISISKYKFNMSILIRYLIFLNQYAWNPTKRTIPKHIHTFGIIVSFASFIWGGGANETQVNRREKINRRNSIIRIETNQIIKSNSNLSIYKNWFCRHRRRHFWFDAAGSVQTARPFISNTIITVVCVVIIVIALRLPVQSFTD